MNPYETYYLNQAGSGMATYTGVRYQKRNGFFGRLISGFAMPLLKYFGKRGLEAAGNVVSEIKQNPDMKMKDILKSTAKRSLSQITDDGASRAKKFILTGKGIKKYKSNALNVKKTKPLRTSPKVAVVYKVNRRSRNRKSENFLK